MEPPFTYESNPVGCLQERMQKLGKPMPEYVAKHELGRAHSKEFVFQVRLHDGLKSQGSGNTKKIAKQNAARHMLDVLDGRAKAINDDVLESIDMGLKALRGGGDKDAGNSKHTNKKSDSSIKKEKDKKESRTPNIYPYNKFQPVKPKQEPGIRKSLEQNRGLNDEIQDIKTENRWISEIVLEGVFKEIEKIERKKNPLPEQICKLCNLVFFDEKLCQKHKKGDNHERVHQGEFPGKGGYHCFLCWVNFLQPESLLNHLARPNHHERAQKSGVLKIWMEPQPIVPTWDTINMMKDLRSLEEEERRERRGRKRSWSRERSPQKTRVRGRSPDEEIKSGVTGDWRKAREKTTVELERISERERREREEKDRIARRRREARERERREWERREREERIRRENQRRRWEDEERYWKEREEAEWRDWQRRRREEEERWEREWKIQEEREWMERKAREWRERERASSSRSLERDARDRVLTSGSRERVPLSDRDVRRKLKKKKGKHDLEDGECITDDEFMDVKPRKHKKSERSKERPAKDKKKSRDIEKSKKTEKSRKLEKSRRDEKSGKAEKSRKREMSQKLEELKKIEKLRMLDRKLSKKADHNKSRKSGKTGNKELDLRELLKKKRALERLEKEDSSSDNSESSDKSSESESSSDSSSDSSTSSSSPEKRKKKKHISGKRGKTNLLVEMKGAILGVLDKEISSLGRK